MRLGSAASGKQRGFTYLWVLVAVAVLGLLLAGASDVWQTTVRRHKMEQLDWAGRQYAQAIGSYVEFSPGLGKSYPGNIADLVEDRRGAVPRRHLRELYPNPFTADGQWELVIGPDTFIHGVRARFPWDPNGPGKEWVYVRGVTR